MTKVLPRRTWSTLATRRLKMSANQPACSGVMLMVSAFQALGSKGWLMGQNDWSSQAAALWRCRVFIHRSADGHHALDAHQGLSRVLIRWWGRTSRVIAPMSRRVSARITRVVRVVDDDLVRCQARVARRSHGRVAANSATDQGVPGVDRCHSGSQRFGTAEVLGGIATGTIAHDLRGTVVH